MTAPDERDPAWVAHLAAREAHLRAAARRRELTAARAVKLRYNRERQRAIRAGTWRPSVDPAECIAHVAHLRAAGMSARSISIAADVSLATIAALAWPERHSCSRTRMTAATAAAILSVTDPRAVPSDAYVLVVGTVRRVQALACMGWPSRAVAEQAGVPRIKDLTRHRLVTKHFADAVADCYDRLCMTPGPSSRARTLALTRGWAPPLAWDDDTVDDPAATPCADRYRPEHLDLNEWVRLVGWDESPSVAAERCGVTLRAVTRAAERAGRDDIARLAERAERARNALRTTTREAATVRPGRRTA